MPRRKKSNDGSFGLIRERLIEKSKVREIFTPYSPIDIVNHFVGRENEVSQLVSVINSPGQHVLLYGDRGVGKTSLAMVTCSLLRQSGVAQGKFFKKSCCSEDTFSSIMHDPLRYVGIDYEIEESNESHNEGGDAKLKALVAEGSLTSRRGKSIKRVHKNLVNSPSWVAERLKKIKGLLLIDEADSLPNPKDRTRIAEFIKILSDTNSKFKVMVVGIAETGDQITDGHPSVERCLKETHLSRMPDDSLKGIIRKGMRELALIPSEDLIERIVNISAGYPHFTHLICLKCAENAILSKQKHIDISSLDDALKDAVDESEGVLIRRYNDTLRGVKHQAEYRLILISSAICTTPEFRLTTVRRNIKQTLGIDIPSNLVSRYMSNMIENGNRGVFLRVSKGVYRFADPRMPSFIKMAQPDFQNK